MMIVRGNQICNKYILTQPIIEKMFSNIELSKFENCFKAITL